MDPEFANVNENVYAHGFPPVRQAEGHHRVRVRSDRPSSCCSYNGFWKIRSQG